VLLSPFWGLLRKNGPGSHTAVRPKLPPDNGVFGAHLELAEARPQAEATLANWLELLGDISGNA